MRNILRFAVLGFVGLAASGCSLPLYNGPSDEFRVEQAFPIAVEPQVATLAVRVDDGMQGIGRGEDGRVQAFVARFKQRGQGVLNAAAPSGSANQAAVQAAMQQLKKMLADNGIAPNAVQFSSYQAPGDDANAPITLSFVTYTANAAECGKDWSENMGFNPRNVPWPEFGCSTQHNLAAIISDPRDLVEPRSTDPIDATRRSTVLDKFRQGLPTQTIQTDRSNSGTVSNVGR